MKLAHVHKIGIVGAGVMGASLAALFTGNGYGTVLIATSAKGVERGLARYRSNFGDLIANGLVTQKQADTCERLLKVTEDYAALADADFVYECVYEDKAVKYAVYAKLEAHCACARGIASATSAIDTDTLAAGFQRPEFRALFAVAHPWNPPHLVPLVEIVKGAETSKVALAFTSEVVISCGRAPIVMHKSVPGFIGNRLQHALFREAAYMVEQGIATPEDIDRAMKSSFIPRYTSISIFEHFDYSGMDMVHSIESTLYPELCAQKEPHRIVREALDRGDLGSKTGRGLLDWDGVDADEFRRRAAAPFLKLFNWNLPE